MKDEDEDEDRNAPDGWPAFQCRITNMRPGLGLMKYTFFVIERTVGLHTNAGLQK
jgi:hypothetical protein